MNPRYYRSRVSGLEGVEYVAFRSDVYGQFDWSPWRGSGGPWETLEAAVAALQRRIEEMYRVPVSVSPAEEIDGATFNLLVAQQPPPIPGPT